MCFNKVGGVGTAAAVKPFPLDCPLARWGGSTGLHVRLINPSVAMSHLVRRRHWRRSNKGAQVEVEALGVSLVKVDLK